MITLHIEDYCKNCPYFEAATSEHTYLSGVDFTVFCNNEAMCHHLLKHLQEVEKRKLETNSIK